MIFLAKPTFYSVVCVVFLGNPNTGIVDLKQSGNGTLFNQSGKAIDPRQASVSWWLIFVCVRSKSTRVDRIVAKLKFITYVFTFSFGQVRQTLTFSGAQLFQVIVVDFLCLSTRFSVNVLGSLFTLFIVQSKGWPFILCMWATFNFVVLFGTARFVQHWLFWQDIFGIFNEKNPSYVLRIQFILIWTFADCVPT